MNLGRIHQGIANLEARFGDNSAAVWFCVIAGLLAFLVFGGLLFDYLLEKRHQRQKAKAVERLLKHISSLPGSKS